MLNIRRFCTDYGRYTFFGDFNPTDYTGLYSQVMHLWQNGFPYWF